MKLKPKYSNYTTNKRQTIRIRYDTYKMQFQMINEFTDTNTEEKYLFTITAHKSLFGFIHGEEVQTDFKIM